MSIRLPGYLTMSGITVQMPEPVNVVVPLNVALSHPKDGRANLEMEIRNAAAKIANTASWAQYMDSAGLTSSIPITINGNTYSGGVWSNGAVPSYNRVDSLNSTNPFGSINIPQPQFRIPVAGSGQMAGPSGRLQAPDYDNSSAIFNLRLSLIEEYCDKWGKSVDVEKLKSEYASDPQTGVEVCDDILNNKFNQAKLKDIVNKKYNDYNKSRDEAGRAVSDKWVDTVLKGKLDNIDISSDGVTKDNLLDVVGTFMTNKDVKNGKVSLYNVFESPQLTGEMIEIMKQKADEILQEKESSDEYLNDLLTSSKPRLLEEIENLRVNYDAYKESLGSKNPVEFNRVRGKLEKSFIKLFEIQRVYEARKNDAVAPQVYGLPQDSEITLNNQTDRAHEELMAYRSRRKLSTKI